IRKDQHKYRKRQRGQELPEVSDLVTPAELRRDHEWPGVWGGEWEDEIAGHGHPTKRKADCDEHPRRNRPRPFSQGPRKLARELPEVGGRERDRLEVVEHRCERGRGTLKLRRRLPDEGIDEH